MTAEERTCILDVVAIYESALSDSGIVDYDGMILLALEAVQRFRRENSATNPLPCRCVIADEIQDFSENEIRLLRELAPVNLDDSLFLVGDGSQKIYTREFSLARLGIDIKGRAFYLSKNYRNTREIMEAAFPLVATHEYEDLDSEQRARPIAPELSARSGARPRVIKFSNTNDEEQWVAAEAARLVREEGVRPGEVLVMAAHPAPRARIALQLRQLGVGACELREDIAADSESVKISTIESAKGHESSRVLVSSLVEGVLPWQDPDEDGERLHASRLYVAMTRARDTLTLTWSIRTGDAQRLRPSRYLGIIARYCDEYQFRDGRLIALRRE